MAAAEVVLHERVPFDPDEDLRLGATTSDGALPAAIVTESGLLPVPQPTEPGAAAAYTEGRTGSGARYRIDANTARPGSVSYTDPFSPTVAPYKREAAYDGVDADFDLVVRDPSRSPIPVEPRARPADDQFFADLDVEVGETAVRIPTPGPGARLLGARATPGARLAFSRDGAEQWFLRTEPPGRYRVVLHLGVDRAVFGSPFADVEWRTLHRHAPSLPPHVKAEGERVAREIGVVDGSGPREALARLVAHFRGFKPSDERPAGASLALYRELALSRKGVCRHRAYAFTVTALALGLPTRFVRNEAHAWVEVSDGQRFHRIDLGGAAAELDAPGLESALPHLAPPDGYPWPPDAESGQGMVDRSRQAALERGPGGAPQGPSPQAATAGGSGSGATAPVSSAASSPAATPPEDPADERPPAELTLRVASREVRRGARVTVSGRVTARGEACAAVRVDLFLTDPGGTGERLPLGVLVTGPEGRYDGAVVVPPRAAARDHVVRARTPGGPSCGPGESP